MLESGRERERERKGSWRRRKRREEQQPKQTVCSVLWAERRKRTVWENERGRRDRIYSTVLFWCHSETSQHFFGTVKILIRSPSSTPFQTLCICSSPAHANRSCSYATVMLSYYGLLNILVPITSDTSLNCNLWRAGRNFQKSDDKLTWLESSVLFLPQLKWS